MRVRKLAFLAASALLVAACGGGGSDAGPGAPPPAGDGNDAPAEAVPVAPGVAAAATIASASDVDYFAFAVPAGGSYVRIRTFDASGAACASIDPELELYRAGDALLDSDGDSGPALCDELHGFRTEGSYHVAVRHGGGGAASFAYTVEIVLLPRAVESEPNDGPDTADGPYSDDVVLGGTMEWSGSDCFAIANDSAVTRTVELETFSGGGVGSCSDADSELGLYTATGTLLRYDDDSGGGFCSALSYAFPAHATYYACVTGFADTTFPYGLDVELR